jgi:hypothetical protein
MNSRIQLVAVVGLVAFWPATSATAQHLHFDGGGIGIHFGDDDHHDDHYDHHSYGRRHYDYGHHHHRSHWHDSDWLFVVPHYDSHYHGTYYTDEGVNYYVPRTYASRSGSYVAAKPVEIDFGGYAHVDDLAGRLERQMNQLCLDLHYNYQHNADFAATYREAYQILETAKYIHDKEHQGDRDEVARRLDEVDGLFHHVEADVADWSRRQKRQIGLGGAKAKLEAVEATLHHLMHDVGVSGDHEPPALPPPSREEVAPPPGN